MTFREEIGGEIIAEIGSEAIEVEIVTRIHEEIDEDIGSEIVIRIGVENGGEIVLLFSLHRNDTMLTRHEPWKVP